MFEQHSVVSTVSYTRFVSIPIEKSVQCFHLNVCKHTRTRKHITYYTYKISDFSTFFESPHSYVLKTKCVQRYCKVYAIYLRFLCLREKTVGKREERWRLFVLFNTLVPCFLPILVRIKHTMCVLYIMYACGMPVCGCLYFYTMLRFRLLCNFEMPFIFTMFFTMITFFFLFLVFFWKSIIFKTWSLLVLLLLLLLVPL